MTGARTNHHGDRGEEGGLLILLMVGVAITSIALGVAVQAWSSTWRRDSEEELIFRGNQYVNAILAYRKEHGGQFPTKLDDLFELGPRRLRYIRKLYRDPISTDGRWGLLYLAPNGQGIYDPGAAQREQANMVQGEDDPFSSWSAPQPTGAMAPGFTPINMDPTGSGVASPGGGLPSPGAGVGGAQGAMTVMTPPPMPPSDAGGYVDEDSISEPPIGWAIVGVVSRASGKRAENTFKIYKGHQHVNEWQFHVFDRGVQLQEDLPTGAQRPRGPAFIGPGYGGKGRVSGIGDGIKPGPGPGRGGGGKSFLPNQNKR